MNHQKNAGRIGQGLSASGGLIQKIGACPGLDSGKLDPLTCPKCSGKMKVISVIEDQAVTRLPCLLPT